MNDRIKDFEYNLTHQILPYLWLDKENYAALIYFVKQNEKENFVGWINKMSHSKNSASYNYQESDFEFINRKIDNVEFFIIKMPEPLDNNMTYYSILTFDFNIKQRIYFDIEKEENELGYKLISISGENKIEMKIDNTNEIGMLVNELMCKNMA